MQDFGSLELHFFSISSFKNYTTFIVSWQI